MSWNDFKQEMLKDKEVKAEYEALQPEYEVVKVILDARKLCNLTQQQLADKSGVDRSDISKLENGNGNPTIKLLQRIASAMDMNLKIEFIPKELTTK